MENLKIVLVEPQIPPNTGNIVRLGAAVGFPVYLVGQLGFQLSNRYLKRAGLDYWEHADVHVEPDQDQFFRTLPSARLHFFSKRARLSHSEVHYLPGDYLVFGSETRGLPQSLFETFADRFRRIPMKGGYVRSLNLASAVAVAVYEAIRQCGYTDYWEATTSGR